MASGGAVAGGGAPPAIGDAFARNMACVHRITAAEMAAMAARLSKATLSVRLGYSPDWPEGSHSCRDLV